MNLPEISVRRHVLAYMLSGVLVLFGVISFDRIGVDRNPEADFPMITVVTRLPGANPEIIDSSITNTIEKIVNGVAGIDHVESISAPDRSIVRVKFEMDKDIDVAFNEVQVKINQILPQLPEEADPPVVAKVESGDNGARVYAENQAKTCGMVGIEYKLHVLPAGSGFDDVAGRVMLLSADETVSAVMLHMPLPNGVDPYRVQRLIAPEKDVEGVNPANIGNVVYGRSSLAPCTGLAVVKMVEQVFGGEEGAKPGHPPLLRGKVAVVVGASDVVGKPIAVLLMRQDATVVSCNKWTPALAELTRAADVLVVAVGKPDLIRPEMVKPGAVVIDVGVNRVTGADGKTRTVGDVSYESVSHVASWISPLPVWCALGFSSASRAG